MLDDRKPGVQSVQDIGSELTRQADDAERKQVEEQLADLTQRWARVNQAADNRQQALEKTMELAKEFHDKVEPFLDWVDGMEKRASGLEPPATDMQKIRGQMEEQGKFNEEVNQGKPDLDDVLLSGRELLEQSAGDEQGKVNDTVGHRLVFELCKAYRFCQVLAIATTIKSK